MWRNHEHLSFPKRHARLHFLLKNASYAVHDYAIHWNLDAVSQQSFAAWFPNELLAYARHYVRVLRVLPVGGEDEPLVLSLLQPSEPKRELQPILHLKAICQTPAFHWAERKGQRIIPTRVHWLHRWIQAQIFRGVCHWLHGLEA